MKFTKLGKNCCLFPVVIRNRQMGERRQMTIAVPVRAGNLMSDDIVYNIRRLWPPNLCHLW